jgi:hypothetical protein
VREARAPSDTQLTRKAESSRSRRSLPPLAEEILAWAQEVRDLKPGTIATSRASLLDFQRRGEISDYLTVTKRELDRYATRLHVDAIALDARRVGCTSESSFSVARITEAHRSLPDGRFQIPRRRIRENLPVFTDAGIEN